MSATRAHASPFTQRLVMLLALAVFINYVDRANLATAAPVLKDELHLSATQIGILLSAFFWTYAPSQLGAGWLAARFSVYRVIAAGFAIWSLATMLTGLAGGFASLFALRLLLGAGESVAFPCSSKLLAQHVEVDARGRANGAIGVGLALGPAFGTYVGGLILARFGWRMLFLSLGTLSLLWLWPWLRTSPIVSVEQAALAAEPGPSFGDIVRRRAALGAGLGHFCSNYTLYFVLSWLPLYLVKERGFSIAEMATLGGTVYLLQAAGALTTGWAQDRWIRHGSSPNRAYKTSMVVSHLVAAGGLLGAVMAPPVASIGCFLLCGVSMGIASPTLFASAQTMAGPHAAARWVGFQNFVGNLSGIIGPAITGLLVDRSGTFLSAFALATAIALLGVVSWLAIVPRIAPLDWTRAAVVPRGALPSEA